MFYPIMINLTGKKVLIVGGGRVAYRKAKKILEFGGDLTILSPEFLGEFKELKKIYKDKLNFIQDIYDEKYIEDNFLVIGSTTSRQVNKKIGEDCKDLNILVNLVDSKDESDFITTSIINNDNLTISISTMGSFPYLCKKIRKDMEKNYGKYDKEYIDILEKLRSFILKKNPDNMREEMEEVLNLDLGDLKDLLKSYENDL